MSSRRDRLAAVFRALADPTRREILDLLRARPRTTGELASAFSSSRFAVMKHVSVLVESNLVVSRRKGRERWNHLNAVPLQEVYERWVRPYEAHWADSLIRLKQQMETAEGKRAMVAKQANVVSVVDVELEITINAPPERVWKAIVEETTLWWRKDFYAGPAKAFVIEPRPGGRVYEDWGGGSGLLWYTVIRIQPHERLELRGDLMPEFGGPATTMLRIALAPSGNETRVTISDSVFGRVDETKAKSFREGWQLLFGEGLKPFVEADRRA